MSQALFTVVVPTHNRPLLLQRAITSLANQTFQDFFLVIVDDAGSYLPLMKRSNRFKIDTRM